ncbi:putative B6R protein [Orthopoxvirus Abatino]|uniref:Putative B6R protein n=1 Tax=Orthopoxvirus Abatino TaxID=2478919 RepID=A0A3G2KY47_9POXV|nr:putative B6R protein [Orthopoxvirus Abatino]AYN64750.1 putative B6R protein [Orthopoxvirus Abatino]
MSSSVDIDIYDAVRAFLLGHYYDKRFIVYGRSNAILRNIYMLFPRCAAIPFDDIVRTMPNESRVKQWVIHTLNGIMMNEHDVSVCVGTGILFMEMFFDYIKNNYKNGINNQLMYDIINSVSIILANERYGSAFNDDGIYIRRTIIDKLYGYVSLTTIGMITGGICYYLLMHLVSMYK